jgi:hypothetical protein
MMVQPRPTNSETRSQGVYPTANLRSMKDSELLNQIERELDDKFIALCREQEMPAAQVFRKLTPTHIRQSKMTQNKKRIEA